MVRSWQEVPLLKVTVIFILGIISYQNFLIKVCPGFLPAMIAIYIFSGRIKNSQHWNIYRIKIQLLFIFFCGNCLTGIYFNDKLYDKLTDFEAGNIYYVAQIKDLAFTKKRSYKLDISVHLLKQGSKIISTNAKIIGYAPITCDLEVGDLIVGNSPILRIEKPLNPYQFDYASYMARNQVYYSTFIKDHSSIMLLRRGRGMNLLSKWKTEGDRILTTYIPQIESASIISSILFGASDALSIE